MAARKTISHLHNCRIFNDQTLVACTFQSQNRSRFAIGRQISASDQFRFHPDLIFDVRGNEAFDLNELNLTTESINGLAAYLPVPECPLEPSLPLEIAKSNPALRISENRPMSSETLHHGSTVANNGKKYFLYGYGNYVRSYSARFFRGEINAIVEYNDALVAGFAKRNQVSYFHDYRDSIAAYQEVDKPAAIISTYHSSHFEIAKHLFLANPSGKVFIEKPLVVNFPEALELIKLRNQGFWFEVGYNRRYLYWNHLIKKMLGQTGAPKVIAISVKEVLIPPTHWYFWPNQGTRITGNLSHWIDLVYFWLKARPIEMTLLNHIDSVVLSIRFEEGSLACFAMSDIGNSLRGVQEKIEVRTGDTTIYVNDYRTMTIQEGGRAHIRRKLIRQKGHDEMYKSFVGSIDKDSPPLYQNDDVFWVSFMIEQATKMFLSKEHYKSFQPDQIESEFSVG